MKKIICAIAAGAAAVGVAAAAVTFSVFNSNDKSYAAEDATSWIPKTYEDAEKFLGGGQINAATSTGNFVIAIKADTEGGYTYQYTQSSDPGDVYSATGNSYKSADGSETITVEVVNFTAVAKSHEINFKFLENAADGNPSRQYEGSFTIDPDLKISNANSFTQVEVENFDFAKKVWEGGGAEISNSTVYIARPADKDLKIELNGILQQYKKYTKGNDSYNLFSYKPETAGDFEIKVAYGDGKENIGTYSLNYDGNGKITQVEKPTETITETDTINKVWYPTDEKTAAEFLSKYPTGAAISGDTLCLTAKNDNIQSFSAIAGDGFTSENHTYGDYIVCLIKAATAGKKASVTAKGKDFHQIYEISSVTDSNGKTAIKVDSSTKYEDIDFNDLSFEKAAELAKKSQIVFNANQGAWIEKYDGETPKFELKGNTDSADFKTYTVTDGQTNYVIAAVTAKAPGNVYIVKESTDSKKYTSYMKIADDLTVSQNENPETDTATTENPHNLWGDANVDGTVNISDVVLINKAITGNAVLLDEGKENSDVVRNYLVNADDSVCLMKFLIGLIKELPVQPQ